MIGPSSQISKILLTLLFLLIIFYIFMDVNLYLRIQNFPIDRNLYFNATSTTSHHGLAASTHLPGQSPLLSPLPSSAGAVASSSSSAAGLVGSTQSAAALNAGSYEDVTWVSCDINPLCHVTVKAMLLDHTNLYLFAPMATMFENIVGFARSNWITPNMISYFHVLVAIASGRMVASDSLGYRRIGVVLFQFRTFLDDLDGHVARVKNHVRGERSEIGTAGYYIDGICDGLGCIALMIGVFVFLKNNPPRRGYAQLQAIIPVSDPKQPDTGVVYKVKVTTKKVAKKVLCFSGQLLFSSTAWNRYIALYQDMLERQKISPAEAQRQDYVFKSKMFFLVSWMWRVFNVHSLLHCVLLSIFCDKLWEFLRMIQYGGFVVLLVAVCVTEMHVLEVQSFIFNTLTGNNTAS